MPYLYSPDDVEVPFPVKGKKIPPQDKDVSPEPEKDSRRAAGEHHFLVANMFGPIDWAVEIPPEKAPEPERKESYWLVDANMFGPMDWAAELERLPERKL